MQFIVPYSKEKDIWNYLNSAWEFTHEKYGRKDIQEKVLQFHPFEFKTKLSQAKTKKEASFIIKSFLDSLPSSFQNLTPIIAKGVENILNEKKNEIIASLEQVYAKKFPFEKITVFLTTCGINPYNYQQKWFMSNRNASVEEHLKTAKHELNHFMFYYYYPQLKSEFGDSNFEKLKEALAILTNPEGNDKPDILELEKFIRKNSGKNVEEIIEMVLETKEELFRN